MSLLLINLLLLVLDVGKLNEVLACDDIWDNVSSKFDDPFDSLECFNLIMNELLDLLIPRKTLRVCNKDCPWLSSASLVRIRHLRDIAHRKALKSQTGCFAELSGIR